MLKNKPLLILVLVLLVNALAYGIIIPLLYPYASRFGIGPVGLSFLFASYSVFQFLATPILGRLSDKYGRKPVLLLCLLGTAVSLAMFATATSALVLFVSRIIDGITGGNNSVAQAMVADETTGEERAQGFGLLWASYGFGFLLGPALGGILSRISLSAPFWFAAALALLGTILGQVILKETLKKKERSPKSAPIFDLKGMARALFAPITGIIILMSFISALALNTFVLGFQTFTVDVLKMSATQIGLLFALFGLVGVIMQGVGIKFLMQKIHSKKTILVISLVLCAVSLLLVSFTRSLYPFVITLSIFMFANAPQMPVLGALLSERTKAEDQGGILGINQSYVSLGQIFGPLIGGVVSRVSVPSVFMMAAGLYAVALLASKWLYIPIKKKFDL